MGSEYVYAAQTSVPPSCKRWWHRASVNDVATGCGRWPSTAGTKPDSGYRKWFHPQKPLASKVLAVNSQTLATTWRNESCAPIWDERLREPVEQMSVAHAPRNHQLSRLPAGRAPRFVADDLAAGAGRSSIWTI